ncbi:MAG: TatD family hydrolase [Dehalococcoidia bacterium]
MTAAGRPADQLDGAPLVDAHAHTWSREFDGDYDAAIERAWDAGLRAVVEVGTDSETSLRALALARADGRVHAAGGLHPHEAKRLPEERDALRALFDGGDFVAVGEIGLDFYRNLSPPEQQHEALQWQLELAREVELPIVIHSRDADEQCFEAVAGWAKQSGRYLGPDREIGMMHCFAGDAALAERYRELGLLISIPGTVTYQNNLRGREVARTVPLNAMLVETDCPYLTPQPHRGTRNEPAYVLWTAQEVAALRGCAVEEVARATAENAARLFGFAL